jgi:hypothetical protein
MLVPLQSAAPPAQWNLSTGQGSAAEYAFTLTTPAGAPYPVGGTTWEYVVRPNAGSGAALFSVTLTPTSNGSLTVTTPPSQVTLLLNPAATAGLGAGPYQHALWMNPGTTSAYLWLTGQLLVNLVPQP